MLSDIAVLYSLLSATALAVTYDYLMILMQTFRFLLWQTSQMIANHY